jgi:small subunit ribosomal protein S21
MRNNEPLRCPGATVFVKDDNVNVALRKFKNKVEEQGKLKTLKEKEFYEKPTTKRKRKAAAGKQRYRKALEKQQLPKKLY